MENIKIEIKQATIQDLQATYEIVNEASLWLKEKYGFTHFESWYTIDRVKANFEKKTVYLLYENDTPVATYTMSNMSPSYYTKEELNSFAEPSSPAYYLTTLCVRPSFQGKGYAKQLISHLETLAKKDNIKYLRFDARGDYKELIQLYTKLGYKIVGEIDDEGTPYYLLEKEI